MSNFDYHTALNGKLVVITHREGGNQTSIPLTRDEAHELSLLLTECLMVSSEGLDIPESLHCSNWVDHEPHTHQNYDIDRNTVDTVWCTGWGVRDG